MSSHFDEREHAFGRPGIELDFVLLRDEVHFASEQLDPHMRLNHRVHPWKDCQRLQYI